MAATRFKTNMLSLWNLLTRTSSPLTTNWPDCLLWCKSHNSLSRIDPRNWGSQVDGEFLFPFFSYQSDGGCESPAQAWHIFPRSRGHQRMASRHLWMFTYILLPMWRFRLWGSELSYTIRVRFVEPMADFPYGSWLRTSVEGRDPLGSHVGMQKDVFIGGLLSSQSIAAYGDEHLCFFGKGCGAIQFEGEYSP